MEDIIDAVLYCRNGNTEAYMGGTCNETDISARMCTRTAMAVRPDRLLAKPGMGFDEGFTIVNNEMERIIRLLEWRQNG